jgi:opacity protein-like surface antigen
MRFIILTCTLFTLSYSLIFSQDEDLLSLVEEEAGTEYITGAFKTNRIVHGHSIENTFGGVLDVKISHRFGTLNTGFFELYGLDNAMVRLGLDYGISDRVEIGIGRSSFRDIYDGFLKLKLIRQSTGERVMPFSLAAVAGLEVIATRNIPDPEERGSSRLSYTYQLIAARKFSEGFSLQLMPTVVHRNLVEFNEENDVFALGIGLRQKLTSRIAITAEYYYVPGDQLPDGGETGNEYYNSFSVGVDIETGGHVFQLHLTNSTAMVHRGFIAETDGNWGDGDIHFGFNISRVFTIAKRDL